MDKLRNVDPDPARAQFCLAAWLAFFFLTGLSGFFFLLQLARLPSDAISGVSLQRFFILALFGALVASQALFFGLAAWRADWRSRFLALVRRGSFLCPALALSTAAILAPQVLLDWLGSLYRSSGTYTYLAYAARLAPLLNWLSLCGALLIALIALFSRSDLLRAAGEQAQEIKRAAWLWLALGATCCVVVFTRLDAQVDPLGSWGKPGVPLLEWQIASAAFLCLLIAPMALRFARGKRVDLWLFLGLYALAVLAWTSQPLVPAYFATPPRAPNFEVYPFSDGATYDQYAQSLLVGGGFFGSAIPQRSLYIVFLAGLHLIAGQSYLSVILAQTLVLALLPAVLFWIGRELHSRPAGLFAGLLVIFRELTAIRAAPFTDNISNSKLYFSELPTALCLAAFTLCFVRWVKQPRRFASAVAAGGFLGMAMLIRTQSFAVIPLALLLVFLAGRRVWRSLLPGTGLIVLGLAVCLLPWYARNEHIAGGLALDNPESQTMVLAQRYNQLTFDTLIPRLPSETDSHYSFRLLQMALRGILRQPLQAAQLIAGHFANNEMGSLLIFPVRFNLEGIADLAWPTFPFWQEWAGSLTFAQALLVAANLGILAAALAAVTIRWGALGFIPMLAQLAYHFSTAVFRSSGERFLLPVDWVFLLYYAIGAAQLAGWGYALLRSRTTPAVAADESLPAPAPPASYRLAGLAGLIFLLVGLSLPLAELAFPPRYPSADAPALKSALLQSLQSVNVNLADGKVDDGTGADAARFLQQPGSEVIWGRALYPRFYARGESEPRTAKTGYAGMDFARLVFVVEGSQNTLAVLPLDAPPALFPNASDVLVAGCQRGSYFIAAFVQVLQDSKPVYLAPGPLPSACGSQH